MKKKHLLFFFLFSISLLSQNKKDIYNLKVYALSVCLQNNYTIKDNNDVTNSLIIQDLTPINLDQLKKLDDYIKTQTKNFSKELPYKEYKVKSPNLILYNCVDFYESKKLKKFIIKVLKEKE